MNDDDSETQRNNAAHETLRARPLLFASIGVAHTLLTAGVVFGWASLLPILRQEGVELTPTQFASVFTHGAIGNYLSSLPFGFLLDKTGPKTCGMVSSALFAVGLYLCSLSSTSTTCLDLGFAILGFVGPAVQLPTLHLARLFPDEGGESGAAALLMSAQAAAFDGGTMVFAVFGVLVNVLGFTTATLFRIYLVVPIFTFCTAVFFWPNVILPDSLHGPEEASYVGRSPYLSPATHLSMRPSSASKRKTAVSLKDAPLSTVLSHPPFYCLGLWVAVHILKLNFVVATINDQLDLAMDANQAELLITIFGAMLPFGFIVLPGVAYLLSRSTLLCFQIANVVGILYGVVLTFFSGVASYDIFVVFVAVATSRQLVYSTVFHQTGELFGFKNYGVLLGLINIVVSGVSLLQGPLVQWAESVQDYFYPNVVLLALTLPLFVIVYWTTDGSDTEKVTTKRKGTNGKNGAIPTEITGLLDPEEVSSPMGRPRTYSDAMLMT